MSDSPPVAAAEALASPVTAGPEAARWVDAFPWIDDVCQGRVSGGPLAAERAAQLAGWRTERPAEVSGSARLERVSVLADIAIEFMPDCPLGRLVPGLAGTTSVADMGMTILARNLLRRAQYETAADLAIVTIGQLARVRTVGPATLTVIVRALIGTASLAPPPATVAPAQAWEAAAIIDLQTLAAWYMRRGEVTRRLLAAPVPKSSPPGGQASWPPPVCRPPRSPRAVRQGYGLRGSA